MSQQSKNALAIIGAPNPRPKPASDRPLPMDGPAMDGSAEPITIDLTAIETRMEPPRGEAMSGGDAPAASPAESGRWKKFALAASLAFAALVGAFGGVAATNALSGGASASASATAAISDETRALQDKVASLSGELAALKSGMASAAKTTSSQLSKIGERLDRAEKAQAEPAAKIVKLAESLDRLERRTVAAASSDTTGSVTTIEKQTPKLATLEGWRLLDYHAGRALLESRNGTLFDVGPGAKLPGVGKVETIKRVDGKVVVTTPKGVIASALEPLRRPPYHLPRGY